MISKKSIFRGTKGLWIVFVLGLGLIMPCLVEAVNLCATDGYGETIFLTIKPSLKKGAISSIVGWIDNVGALILPVHGSSVVNAEGTVAKITLESVSHVSSQRVGIGMDTDLKLNGTGSFQNINNGTYSILATSWTAIKCPKEKPVFSSSSASQLGESSVMIPPPTMKGID